MARTRTAGGAIVRGVTFGAVGLGGCWLVAFGSAYGVDVPMWAVGAVALVITGVAGFVWLLSKIAHGGDWANPGQPTNRQRRGVARRSPEIVAQAAPAYEVSGV